LQSEPKIRIVPNLTIDNYEAIVAQDVLEHVDDPIKLACEIASSVRIGGKVIFANCFYPIIQCHLPKNFYLRYTFPLVMYIAGLRYITRIKGAEHALVFERTRKTSINRTNIAIPLIKIIGNTINKIMLILSSIKKYLKGL